MSLYKTLQKKFGTEAVIKITQAPEKINVIPTNIPLLDKDLFGCGGLPLGRMVEMYGPESGGKTTLALKACAAAQKAGGECLFIDAEHALDIRWAKQLGVDIENLLIVQPDNGEQALEIVDEALKSETPPSLIVVDSVAALVPKAELDGEMGDSVMGVQSRLLSQACRKLVGNLSKSKTCLIWINQIREKIGVMYGDPTTTTGGRALKFFCSIRMYVSKGLQIKEGTKVVGQKIKVKTVKNKVAPPFIEGELDFYFNGDIGDLVEKLITSGEVEQKGAWYIYKGNKYQGKEKLLEAVNSTEV